MSSVLSPHSARLTESHGGDACASSDAQKTSSEWSLASKTPAKIGSELFLEFARPLVQTASIRALGGSFCWGERDGVCGDRAEIAGFWV